MAEGLRDAFIENDVIGNYAAGTNFLGSSTIRARRKKIKRSRKKIKHKTYKRRKRRSHKRNSKPIHTRRKGKKGRKYPHWLKKYWFKKRR